MSKTNHKHVGDTNAHMQESQTYTDMHATTNYVNEMTMSIYEL